MTLPADRYIEEALRRGNYTEVSKALQEVKNYQKSYSVEIALARMIEKYEPIPEPVDPDTVAVREILAELYSPSRDVILAGNWDDTQVAHSVHKGIKAAREKEVL